MRLEGWSAESGGTESAACETRLEEAESGSMSARARICARLMSARMSSSSSSHCASSSGGATCGEQQQQLSGVMVSMASSFSKGACPLGAAL